MATKVYLHGEGKSDLGQVALSQFEPGPCYHLLQQASSLTLEPHYFGRQEIDEEARRHKSFPRPGRGQNTALYFKYAHSLAVLAARDSHPQPNLHLCLLFRDADGTRSASSDDWQEKVNSVVQGFKAADCPSGVAMIPRPKSEAWILCALRADKSRSCASLEDRSGNDDSPDNLKDELKKLLVGRKLPTGAATISNLIREGTIDYRQIKMSSFESFLKMLREAEKNVRESGSSS